MKEIKKQELASELVDKYTFYNQSMLFTDDKIDLQSQVYIQELKSENLMNEYGEMKEVFEWWLVDRWIAGDLKDRGELIVEDLGCQWWGRTTTGQAIHLDEVIQDIAIERYKM